MLGNVRAIQCNPRPGSYILFAAGLRALQNTESLSESPLRLIYRQLLHGKMGERPGWKNIS
jgi:hypothetical protein